MKKIILLLLILTNFLITTAFAFESFVIKKIQIVGLQRISEDTVLSYLPIKAGEKLSASQTVEIIHAIYATGFFEQVKLAREENILIIKVVERPTIGQLTVTGNSAIPKDKLMEVMSSVNVAEGRVYDRAILEKIKQSLINQYYVLGRYNARVDVKVSPLPRNRVLVDINISEGLVAKVRGINIIGNKAYSQKQLTKQLALSTPGLFTFFTQKDRFSQEKLDQSLENIHNFYLDHGYLRFKVISSQAEVTPDRKSIYIVMVVEEGDQYKVKGYDLQGNLILPREELMKKVTVKSGDIFTRKTVLETERKITDALGDQGYISADVSMNPKIDDTTKEAELIFIVKPGKLTYVRNITFTDNAKTNDVVLRREMEQMEASLAKTSKLQQSKRRLLRLPYIKEAQMSVLPAEESDDQVDVNFKVTEDSAATANFNVGYSQVEHIIIGAGLNQKNFLGTGNTLGLNFNSSRYMQYYGVSYTNPYFTQDGISRSTSVAFSKFDPDWANSTNSYKTDQYSFMDVFSIPLGQELGVFNRLQLGYGYENTLLHVNEEKASDQVLDFMDEHGSHFQQIDLIMGFSRDSRDRYIFPTSGMLNSLSGTLFLPAQSHGLTYYKLNYESRYYHPLPYHLIATARGQVGYGNSTEGAANFPFYKNFYTGGIDSIRGYEGNTVGPRDSNNKPTGGNFLADGSIGLIFPNHISENLRTTVFIDGGNVYDTFNNEKEFNGTGSGHFRFSYGIEADWLTPMGLIDLSYARPLNHQDGDKKEYFQFALGANFG